MGNKYDASASLKEAIALLEIRQAEEGRLLKEQLFVVYDKLKPINLIKSTFEDIGNSLEMKRGLINNLLGVLMGYLTQKIFVGSKPGLFRKLTGIVLEYGVATVVSKYAETLKAFGMQLISQFLSQKSIEEREPSYGINE